MLGIVESYWGVGYIGKEGRKEVIIGIKGWVGRKDYGKGIEKIKEIGK